MSITWIMSSASIVVFDRFVLKLLFYFIEIDLCELMDYANEFSFNILFYSLNLFYYFLYLFILVYICGLRKPGSKPRRNDLGTDYDGVRKLWLGGGRSCLSESLD